MIFLSFPYTCPDKEILLRQYSMVEALAASMISLGYSVISPVIHWHNIIMKYNIPTGFDFWEKYCLETLKMCNAIAVLKFPNWENSTGVNREIEYAKYIGIKIVYIDLLEDFNIIFKAENL